LGFKASDQYQLTNSYSHLVSEKIICSKCKRSYFEKSKAYSLGFDRLENAIAGREVGDICSKGRGTKYLETSYLAWTLINSCSDGYAVKPFQRYIHASENKWGGETITISRAINYPTHLKVDVAH
jgi:hypothetical protein